MDPAYTHMQQCSMHPAVSVRSPRDVHADLLRSRRGPAARQRAPACSRARRRPRREHRGEIEVARHGDDPVPPPAVAAAETLRPLGGARRRPRLPRRRGARRRHGQHVRRRRRRGAPVVVVTGAGRRPDRRELTRQELGLVDLDAHEVASRAIELVEWRRRQEDRSKEGRIGRVVLK